MVAEFGFEEEDDEAEVSAFGSVKKILGFFFGVGVGVGLERAPVVFKRRRVRHAKELD
jgi:hypothetical protein